MISVVALAIGCIVFVALIIATIIAPDGYEDDGGFHLGNDPHVPVEFHSNHNGKINP